MSATLSLFSEFETIQLSSGAKLYYRQDKSAPRQSLVINIAGGNRLENTPGLVDLLDNLLEQGTATMDAEAIAIALDSIPLELDIDSHRDYSVVGLTMMPEDHQKSLELTAHLLYESTLADFSKEIPKMIGEMTMGLDSPATLAKERLYQEMMAGTPYQANALTMLESLPTIKSIDALKGHHEKYYQPANMTFVGVGPLSKEAVMTHINETFEKKAPTDNFENERIVSIPSLQKSDYITIAKNDSQQLHLYQSFYAPTFTHPDYPALVVLNTVLGGAGLSSRLFIEIRDKQGLAYNVRSQIESNRYFGLMNLYVGTEPKNRQKVIDGFAVEINKLIDVALTPEELSSAKENILGRQSIMLERPLQQANYYSSKLAVGAGLDDIVEYANKISKVTIADVQRVAQIYLAKPSVISAVGPADAL